MANLYNNKGQEESPFSEFEDYLDFFSKAKNLEFLQNEGVLEVRYELEGEKKVLFTTAHILLAACSYCREGFFKNPLENLLDARISRKTPC